MGNRAVITTQKEWCRDGVGIYVHWNGGRDSVNAFCNYCRCKRYRSPDGDSAYGLARLTQVISNFFGGSTSIGLVKARDTCGDDNGTYFIGKDWQIVRHIDPTTGMDWTWGEQDNYDLAEFVQDINKAQPEPIQDDLLLAFLNDNMTYEEKIARCNIGTKIAVFDDLGETWQEFEVLGFGDKTVNGYDRTKVPFYNFRHYGSRWSDPVPDTDIETIKSNPNSYLGKHKWFVLMGA